MSVIQKIRDKYARWAVVAIALSLIGFILMDAFTGKSNLFSGGNSTRLGTVNGKTIDYLEFEKKVKAQEERQQAQGTQQNEATRQQLVQNMWNQEVNIAIMNAEFDKLGFGVGKKEISDYLFGNNPPPDLKQQFSDPKTGVYDAAQAQQFVNQLKRSKKQEDRDQLAEYIASLEAGRMMEKYTSLLTNSIYYPKWLIEKQNTESSGLAKVSYVRYPYSNIQDSAVKITDKEIEEYIKKHKDQYKQEESRSISYVVFSAAPTATDSAETRKQLEAQRTEYLATKDPAAFIARYSSNPNFYDNYIVGSNIKVPFADSIKKLADGEVFGPYLDGGNYTMAKMIARRNMPDTVKVRHILIKVADRQNGQMRDDSTAKKLADSIQTAVAGGADFNALVLKYSDDEGSKNNKGEYTFGSATSLVKNFYETAFYEPTGTKKVVKGESNDYIGYHYMEVMEQRNIGTAYKVAYLSKEITPSTETENNAVNEANKFGGESRDLKSFNANADSLSKKGFPKVIASNIAPDAYSITGLPGTCRQLVRAIYDAKKGEVLTPVLVGDKYVVAVVTEILEEGIAGVNTARSGVEPILRNQKKAEQIKQKIGKITTLEELSAKLGIPIESVDSIRFNTTSKLGYENKIIGAAFNPANKGKVVPETLAGTNGVYILRVDDLSATSVAAASIDDQKKSMRDRGKQSALYSQPTQALRLAAKIKDQRRKFY